MDEQDPGILGNLPRSRPGTRSAKRAREENLEQAAGAPPVEPSTAVPRRSTSSRPRKPRRPKATDSAARHRATRAGATRESAQDPVTGAVQLMGRVASVSVQMGTGVAREVLRRLPGPW